MTQQDDITQRVLTDAEIQALWDEACKDSPRAPGWNRHIRFARALLSKVPAPIADSTLRLEQALHELIDKIVPGLDTGDLVQDARRASTALSATLASAPVTDERDALMRAIVKAGQDAGIIRADLETVSGPECLHILECLSKASAPVADERFKPPFDNCSFRMCDLPGQCRGEGKCHHPASAPVAGEALTAEAVERQYRDGVHIGSGLPRATCPCGFCAKHRHRFERGDD
ncbi:hypothetical protein, partial [Achromobacter xylosoxidans]